MDPAEEIFVEIFPVPVPQMPLLSSRIRPRVGYVSRYLFFPPRGVVFLPSGPSPSPLFSAAQTFETPPYFREGSADRLF